ncbi:MAG: hypothetical protein AAB436_02320 [Patescibacteria group bacterium]
MAPRDNQPKSIFLPTQVVGPVDVARLLRELEAIDDALLQLSLRSGGEAVKVPKTTLMMDKTIEQNKLNLLQAADRMALLNLLSAAKERAPRLHISFSADPSPIFVDKLVGWLRKEIHPFLLLSVGLQPTIGAGCMVRSINHRFDLSLRQDFANKRDLLLQQLMAQPTQSQIQPQPQVQGVKA